MSNIEKIRQEIERRKKEHMYDEMPITIGRYYEDRDLLAFIDFDLQEQPEVDIEKEYKEYVEDDPVFSVLTNRNVGLVIARHFYELGLNTRKEE